jgi:hypothetical protein
MPIPATPAATVETDGPGFGAGAIGGKQHHPAQHKGLGWRRPGDTRSAGTWAVS